MRFIGDAELRGLDARALEDLVESRELVVAFGESALRGRAAAALLFADYAVLGRNASIEIDSAEGWAGAVWRLGRGAFRWFLRGGSPDELVDEVTTEPADGWLGNWMRGRSVVALDSAAGLIRARGGDRLERAEFARLFATGGPAHGLGAFLAKKSPRYS